MPIRVGLTCSRTIESPEATAKWPAPAQMALCIPSRPSESLTCVARPEGPDGRAAGRLWPDGKWPHLVEWGGLVVGELERREHRVGEEQHKDVRALVIQHRRYTSAQATDTVAALAAIGGVCDRARLTSKVKGRAVRGGEGRGDQLGRTAGGPEDGVSEPSKRGSLVRADGRVPAARVHLPDRGGECAR
eukprot:scaffold191214_cov31-Tisochrysis_lutea.AAC.1